LDREDIMQDAMEARLNKLQTEFDKQTKLLQGELTVLKNELLVGAVVMCISNPVNFTPFSRSFTPCPIWYYKLNSVDP
jgi:hypothetical protein